MWFSQAVVLIDQYDTKVYRLTAPECQAYLDFRYFVDAVRYGRLATSKFSFKMGSPMMKGLQRTIHSGSENLWALFRETGASLLTYELYPLGIVGKSIPAVPKLWAKKQTEKLPILFVHGIFHNRSAFAWLKQRLSHNGWHYLKEIDLMTTIHPIPVLAEQVATQTRALMKELQVPQIDIVAHSMGGIVARYFVQCLGGDGLVRNLITLGTPHCGTLLSRYTVLPHLREMRPGSSTVKKLCSLGPPQFTRAVSVSGTLDVIVLGRKATHWAGVRNIRLKRIGHAGLLFSKRVFQIISSHCDAPIR